ncbi:MAG: serine/threonine-protein phosphatase, partial [Myxococcales bacterium]|nr:serine/threonine-protein phosphatase [Myxococcales bacterium]
EVASQLAIDTIFDRMSSAAGHGARDQLAGDVVDALEVAGIAIFNHANKNRAMRGMGTTATVAALVDDHLLLGQVGDSRAYVLRGDRLVQVTRDQSLVNQLIEAGQLTEEDAETFEHSNIILQALGTADAVQVDLTYVQLRRGDILMMCSDGLSGMLRDREIRAILLDVESPESACRTLVDDANSAGGQDNITVIVAVFGGDGLAEPTEEDRLGLKYMKYALPLSLRSRGDFGELGVRRQRPDEAPTIEIVREYEIDHESSLGDLVPSRRRGTDGTAQSPRYAMWALVLAFVAIGWLLLKK